MTLSVPAASYTPGFCLCPGCGADMCLLTHCPPPHIRETKSVVCMNDACGYEFHFSDNVVEVVA